MSDTVIRVEGLAKRYRLGLVGGTALHEDLNRWWARLRGRPDPFLKVTEANVREVRARGDYVWALRDVSFELKQGEVLGIIGRNGAGKSTLLKILSRITSPTEGRALLKGRVGSLLEVGTGFHPELTGRENIYLNGAILGMTRAEIGGKLDEIVSFSGCERYIDTPVKRYSSGMLVRLGFSVAAHLEPEILIVDEVLAVGDAEFQKKCLGKMQDVAGHGRTVLFVSHNMTSVERLCGTSLLLASGGVARMGPSRDIIADYLRAKEDDAANLALPHHDPLIDILEFALVEEMPGRLRSTSDAVRIRLKYRIKIREPRLRIGFDLYSVYSSQILFRSFDDDAGKVPREPGTRETIAVIPGNLLRPGVYEILLRVRVHSTRWVVRNGVQLNFRVENIGGVNSFYAEKRPGLLMPKILWTPRNLTTEAP